jgi:hypothetical protein
MNAIIKVAACAILFCGSLAYAAGGMIGGGEVSYKALMTCDAGAIDSKHQRHATQVWVVREVGNDGNDIPDAHLRVVTFDKNSQPIRYFVTHDTTLALSPGGQVRLDIWRYALGSDGNRRLGYFTWNDQSKAGLFTIHEEQGTDVHQLTNCKFNTGAQKHLGN